MQRTTSAFSLNYNQYHAALSISHSTGLFGVTNLGHNRIFYRHRFRESSHRRNRLVLVPKLNPARFFKRIGFNNILA